VIIPTASTISLTVTGTDASSIFNYCLYDCIEPDSNDPFSTVTFTYSIPGLIQKMTGTTNRSDGGIFGSNLWAEDGAGNTGEVGPFRWPQTIDLVYDNPHTPVDYKTYRLLRTKGT